MKKVKLALIGDDKIQYYSIAERLWELLAAVSNVSISYSVIPLATPHDVREFFRSFQRQQTYQGFNVATLWKGVLAEQVDELEPLSRLPLINTVYRNNGKIIGADTDPLAAQKAVEYSSNLYKCASALVLSSDGSGLAIACHLKDTLGISTYVYDTGETSMSAPVTYLTSLDDVAAHTYDLVINTTPLGRYCFDHGIAAFSSPLSLELLAAVTHADSIVQEVNYLPINTLLIQLAQSLGRKTVTGELMLCLRGNESLKRFCDTALDERTLAMVIEEVRLFVADHETAVLKLNAAKTEGDDGAFDPGRTTSQT